MIRLRRDPSLADGLAGQIPILAAPVLRFVATQMFRMPRALGLPRRDHEARNILPRLDAG